jgi:hypothetical protein
MADDVATLRELFEKRWHGILLFETDSAGGYTRTNTAIEWVEAQRWFGEGVAFQQVRELAAMRAEIARQQGEPNDETN